MKVEKKEDKLPPRGETAKKTVKKPRKPKETKAIVPATQEVGLVPINLNSLMTAAIKKGKEGIEMLERLMALKERMEKEEARKAYFDALARFQRDCPIIPKTKNAYNRYNYAPIEEIVKCIKEPLAKNGLSFTLDTKQTDKEMTGIFVGHHFLGHEERTSITVPFMFDNKMNAAQSVISARTYASRIAICNGLGIATADEDDDGRASGPDGEPTKPKVKGGKGKLKAAPPKVEDAQEAPKERDATPSPEEKRKYTIPQLKERCMTGLTFLIKSTAIDQDQHDSILTGINELVEKEDYDNLSKAYTELREMYDSYQKSQGGKKQWLESDYKII